MPGTREYDAKKAERLAREQRFYTVDLLGRDCPGCHAALPLALVHAGIVRHPTCWPEDRHLMLRV